MFGQVVRVPADARCFALLDMVAVGGELLCSNGTLIPRADFCDSLPVATPATSSTARAPIGRRLPVPKGETHGYAWLSKFVQPAAEEVGEEQDRLAVESRRRPMAVLDDDDIEAVFEELEAKRREWCMDSVTAETAFKTRVLGGKWTAENLHVAADAISSSRTSRARRARRLRQA